MPSYRELLQQTKDEIDEIDAREAQDARRRASGSMSARHDEWDEGHIPGAIHIPRGNLESRIESRRARPVDADRPLLRLRRRARPSPRRRSPSSATSTPSRSPAASPTGSATATRSRCRSTLSPEKRARYSRHLADPRDRRGGPAQAARLEDPAARRRRPRLARRALPRRRRRRAHRDHRRRHRRRVEPAAPDRALAEHARHAEGRQREARDRGAQPGRAR